MDGRETMQVEVLSTDELGDRSYVAHDLQVAVVVDPQRDIARIEQLLADAGVAVDLVVETHIHNDYVTGGYQLTQRTGARYAVNAADPVAFDRIPVHDGHTLEAGTLRLQGAATPGHTRTHPAYLITYTARPHEPPAVLTRRPQPHRRP